MSVPIEERPALDPQDGIRERFPEYFAEHCDDGEFYNPWSGKMGSNFGDLLKWQFSSNPHKERKRLEQPVAPDQQGLAAFEASDADIKLVWLGHASYLLEIDGLRVLIDPVVGRAGVFVKRFSQDPYQLDELPDIHAVFNTHGHYDHLDKSTLARCAELWPEARFVTPLGQGRYLPRACGDVLELDWWERIDIDGIEGTLVPVQHWHRRGLADQNAALWGGWVFGGRVFHAGDSGYCDVFSLLGELFDLEVAMLPVGAYEPRWFMKPQHMNPEEALQAFRDLGADHLAGMHWGTFDLTDEPLNEGAERIRELADEADLAERVHVPPPGGAILP
jgi:L-ascorbate metabolism protein UlaG (beta-lactamase superfamily)